MRGAMMASEFPVRVGSLLITTSVAATALCVGMAALLHYQVAPSVPGGEWLWLPLLAMPLLCLPFIVRGYRIDGRVLHVRRLLHEDRIELKGLQAVELRPRLFAGTLRTFGNGGFYSFTGGYWGRELGRLRAYATDTGPGLLLQFEDRGVLLSPADPAAMAERLRQAAGLERRDTA